MGRGGSTGPLNLPPCKNQRLMESWEREGPRRAAAGSPGRRGLGGHAPIPVTTVYTEGRMGAV